jgi:nucleotide-binding universal stress UspA family protein
LGSPCGPDLATVAEPRLGAHMSYATIAVGTDGSESSLRAVERAAELSAESGASLVVVCAYHPMTSREQAMVTAAVGDARFRVTGSEAAAQALQAAADHARAAGAARVDSRLVEGDAVEAMLSLSNELSLELLVVGNRGINTLSGRLLGSVASDLSQRAPCDVLIVHTTSGGRS